MHRQFGTQGGLPTEGKVRLGPEERAGAVAVVVAEWRSESAPGSAF